MLRTKHEIRRRREELGDVRRLVEVRVTVERLMSDFNGRFVCCQERAFRQLP